MCKSGSVSDTLEIWRSLFFFNSLPVLSAYVRIVIWIYPNAFSFVTSTAVVIAHQRGLECSRVVWYVRHIMIILTTPSSASNGFFSFTHFTGKLVPFVELTVAHASILTILAISFERYYAICEPLKAGYVCTKARAMVICVVCWCIAGLFTR